jgi:hypothetical protein
MSPVVIRDALHERPFRPFFLVQTDGTRYEIRHPDSLFVGQTFAVVGLFGQQAQEFPERYITLDLLHIMRLEPAVVPTPQAGNGQGQQPS